MSLRILHVDDDPDIRDVVEISLNVDPEFTVISCASAIDALATAAEWAPDLVLSDVLMPGMSGPVMLTHLREDPRTAKIPIIFMTARAQTGELEQLKLLGATAVFTKPFDPMYLAAMVRGQLHSIKLDAARYNFAGRLRADAVLLAGYRKTLSDNSSASMLPDGLESCAHKLSGAAAVFNFKSVSLTASALEHSIIERRAGRGTPGTVESNLDALLECIEHA